MYLDKNPSVSLGQPAWDQHGPPLGKASNQLPEPQYRHLSAVSEKGSTVLSSPSSFPKEHWILETTLEHPPFS
jgi:hypothetical protein